MFDIIVLICFSSDCIIHGLNIKLKIIKKHIGEQCSVYTRYAITEDVKYVIPPYFQILHVPSKYQICP